MSGGAPRVLLVEDDDLQRFTTGLLLEDRGYLVEAVGSLAAARAAGQWRACRSLERRALDRTQFPAHPTQRFPAKSRPHRKAMLAGRRAGIQGVLRWPLGPGSHPGLRRGCVREAFRLRRIYCTTL